MCVRREPAHVDSDLGDEMTWAPRFLMPGIDIITKQFIS